jgi:hypothetical protein
MKNTFRILTIICALVVPTLAQDKQSSVATLARQMVEAEAEAKAKAKKTTPPASVEFTLEQVKEAGAARDKARLSALEAENLALKIEAAQLQYQKLRDEASKAQAIYGELLRDFAGKLGIPKEELPNYEFSDADGKLMLKRKERR